MAQAKMCGRYALTAKAAALSSALAISGGAAEIVKVGGDGIRGLVGDAVQVRAGFEAAIAAVLPGGDPISMGLLMIPQVVLYGVGIALSARFGQQPLWRRQELDAM